MKIAFLVPTTTKGKDWSDIKQTYLYRHLFDSCSKTLPKSYSYRFYLGVDSDDRMYNYIQLFPDIEFDVKIIKFEGIQNGHLTRMWNELYKHAYNDGFDYFIQCGDDVEFLEYGWLEACISALQINNNIGVSGPIDINNKTLLTQTVVSRKHMEIFGWYFPEEIRNWYCDNWINDVYKAVNKFYVINKFCFNKGGKERYEIEHNGRIVLKNILEHHVCSLLEYLNINANQTGIHYTPS